MRRRYSPPKSKWEFKDSGKLAANEVANRMTKVELNLILAMI